MVKISASILSADFSNLEKEIKKCEKSGVDFLHLDVMDGNFVNNITFGAPLISSIRPKTKMIFDTHLMISKPEFFIEDFAKAGSDIITIHVESVESLKPVLLKIKSLGKKCGVSLRPKTNLDKITDCIDILDLILIMTVEPGFSGQKFMPEIIKKISQAKTVINQSKKDIMLEVDGGINNETGKIAKNAGANVLVSGNYIFSAKNEDDMEERVKKFKAL